MICPKCGENIYFLSYYMVNKANKALFYLDDEDKMVLPTHSREVFYYEDVFVCPKCNKIVSRNLKHATSMLRNNKNKEELKNSIADNDLTSITEELNEFLNI